MIEMLHFLNQEFILPVAIGAALLFALFIWKEWSFPLKAKFYLHVLIALVSLISLAMLALKPMLSTSVKTNPGVLLTKNYAKESLDSLKKEYRNLKVIPYKVNKPIGEGLDAISPLFILGKGLQSFDFWQLKNIPSKYLGAAIPKGIIKLNYRKQLVVGDELVVRGIYNSSQEGHRLLLADSSGNQIDSVLMNGNQGFNFELTAGMKVKGNYLYTIIEKNSLGEITSGEPLPIRVLPKEKLKILMVNSFPTFESKYLKNFLAEAEHELIVRSQLTKGKFKFEYFNTERSSFYSFSKKLVASIDLMIIDANSYVNLSRKSLQNFEEAIQGSGLGVFILPNDSFFRIPVKTSNFEFLRQKSSKIKLDKWPRLSLEKYPYVYKDNYRLEEVHRSNEMILTAYRRKGKGRIGTTVIKNSYQFLLAGNSEAYRQLWTETISALSKRKESSAAWNSNTEFAFENEPFSFEIRTSENNIQVVSENGNIPMMQDPDIREYWSGITYPRDRGWKSIRLKNDSTATLEFYVMDSTKWKSITASKTRAENERQFHSIVDVPTHKKISTPINQLWFFLIFILGLGYLWFAPKRYSN